MSISHNKTQAMSLGKSSGEPVFHLGDFPMASAIRSAMKSLKLKPQDEKDQGLSVQEVFAANKPTKLAYKILINKKIYSPSKESRKPFLGAIVFHSSPQTPA